MQKKILVVEDEFIIAMDIEDTLTRMGYITENKILTGESAIKQNSSIYTSRPGGDCSRRYIQRIYACGLITGLGIFIHCLQ
jgi:hypothetical protein